MYSAVEGVGFPTGVGPLDDSYYINPVMQEAFFERLDDYARELSTVICVPHVLGSQVTEEEIADAEKYAEEHSLVEY